MSASNNSWQSKAEQSNKEERLRTAKKYKGVGSIGSIDPYTPPIIRDGAIAPPVKPGAPTSSITTESNAKAGMKSQVQKAPAKPGDIKRPTQSDMVKT